MTPGRVRRRGPRRGPGLAAACAIVLVLLSSACSASSRGHEVTILAASSLSDALTGLEADIEQKHQDLDVTIAFAGSSTIVSQVNHGAPADLIVLASEDALRALQPQASPQQPVIVATNRLTLAVPAGNPGSVADLADLARPDLDVVICDVQVPCGAAAIEVLRRADVTAHIVSHEPDVRSVLTKLRLGEADAGLVYATDVVVAGREVIELPLAAEHQVVTRYPALALTDSAETRAVLADIAGDLGRARLIEHGFGVP